MASARMKLLIFSPSRVGSVRYVENPSVSLLTKLARLEHILIMIMQLESYADCYAVPATRCLAL